MSVALRPVAAVLSVLALAACDAAPGLAPEAARPTFAEVAITPVDVSLADAAETATIPLAVSGTLAADGPVEVRVDVRYADTDSLVTAVTETVAPGAFAVAAPFTVPRGAIGGYAVRVLTEGADGRVGDQAAAVVQFTAENLGAPVVTVNEPGAVTRPSGDGSVDVPLLATVADPDGPANVALVFAQIAGGGPVIGRIFDEGDGEDAAAGDGVFTGAIPISADFEPGRYDLEVIAVDRYGAASDPAPFTFTVR